MGLTLATAHCPPPPHSKYIAFLIASATRCTLGTTCCNNGLEYGIGTSSAATRTTWLSRSSKQCSCTSAASSAPIPHVGYPVSTVTQ